MTTPHVSEDEQITIILFEKRFTDTAAGWKRTMRRLQKAQEGWTKEEREMVIAAIEKAIGKGAG